MLFPCHLHDYILAALESQSRIGWEEALSGFLSKRWSILSSLDMNTPNKTDTALGVRYMRACISSIHGHSQRMWLARSGVLRSNDDDQLKTIRSAEAAKIRELYLQPHLLRIGDRHYCERSHERPSPSRSTVYAATVVTKSSEVYGRASPGWRATIFNHRLFWKGRPWMIWRNGWSIFLA